MEETILLTCARGTAPVLAGELTALGLPVVREEAALVETRGDVRTQMRLLLHLRTAHRVLVPVAECAARDAEALYRAMLREPWENHLGPDGYVRVHGHIQNDSIRDGRYAFLKLKDAVMDRLRRRYGRRPDSGPEDHGAGIFLHWVGERARVCLDLSGPTLSRRGYRIQGGTAPLQEALAAAVLLAGGWPATAPLANPMCGSGTLAIEAALLARHQAPGLQRGNFGLFHLRRHDAGCWREEVKAAQAELLADGEVPPILASDNDPALVEIARRNAARAGVEHLIQFSVGDFRTSALPEAPGAWVVLNPPYGQRLEAEPDLEGFYAEIGRWLKGLHTGGAALVISGNLPLSKRFGLKLDAKSDLFNGPIECRLLRFRLD